MAIAPLFLATMDILKKKVRLSDAVNAGTLAVLDTAVEYARIQFYDSLGPSTVLLIQSTIYVVNPTSEPQILRAKANFIEVALVERQLLTELKTLYQGDSDDAQNQWNDEELIRGRSPDQIEADIERLDDVIASGLLDLEMGEPEDSNINIYTSTPDPTKVPRPGDSIRVY